MAESADKVAYVFGSTSTDGCKMEDVLVKQLGDVYPEDKGNIVTANQKPSQKLWGLEEVEGPHLFCKKCGYAFSKKSSNCPRCSSEDFHLVDEKKVLYPRRNEANELEERTTVMKELRALGDRLNMIVIGVNNGLDLNLPLLWQIQDSGLAVPTLIAAYGPSLGRTSATFDPLEKARAMAVKDKKLTIAGHMNGGGSKGPNGPVYRWKPLRAEERDRGGEFRLAEPLDVVQITKAFDTDLRTENRVTLAPGTPFSSNRNIYTFPDGLSLSGDYLPSVQRRLSDDSPL